MHLESIVAAAKRTGSFMKQLHYATIDTFTILESQKYLSQREENGAYSLALVHFIGRMTNNPGCIAYVASFGITAEARGSKALAIVSEQYLDKLIKKKQNLPVR